MSDPRTQQLLKYSNYYGTGFPYYTDVYIPVINAITNYPNIVLNRSADAFYTVRSSSGNTTIDKLVVGNAVTGMFTETPLTGDAITIAGTFGTSYYNNYCQVKWWNSTNIAVFTLDQDSPYALKLYTVNISTGATDSIATLISTVSSCVNGTTVGVNDTNVYVITETNKLKKFSRAGVSIEDYIIPLYRLNTSSTNRTFTYNNQVAITNTYLYVYFDSGSYDDKLLLSTLSNPQKLVCIGDNFDNIMSNFTYGADFDKASVYLDGQNGSLVYISDTDSNFIKFGVL